MKKYSRWEFRLALAKANQEKHAYKKCQALSWVARFGPEHHVASTIAAAVLSASTETDPYNEVFPLAWPLRALLELGKEEDALELLYVVIKKSKRITPRSSKSEALFLIFQASMNEQNSLWPIAFKELINASLPIEHWRQKRNMRDAILMAAGRDISFAESIVEKIEDEKLKETTHLKLSSGDFLEPRRFYW